MSVPIDLTVTNAVAGAGQTDTFVVAGSYVPGDTATIQIGNTPVTYQVQVGDIVAGNAFRTRNNIAAGLAAAINDKFPSYFASATFTIFNGSGGYLYVIGPDSSTSYAITTSTVATSAVTQVDTITLGGTYAAGDQIAVTINNHAVNYTVKAGDVVDGNSAATLANIRTAVIAAINGDNADAAVVTAASGGGGVRRPARCARRRRQPRRASGPADPGPHPGC